MKILAGTILTFFLGLMFVSLIQVSGHMDMTHNMTGCPFISHEEVICPMNLIDHIGAWKSLFFTLNPSVFSLVLSIAVIVLLGVVAPHLIYKWAPLHIRIHWQQLIGKTYTYTVRPLQELFSSGILNPKLH